MNNPYTSRGPLHDAGMFFGRTHELNEIGCYLRGNQSVSIVGPRKIGKSSLMLHLMQPEAISALQLGHDHLFVYIDCQVLNNCGPDEIFAYFCSEAAAALRARNMEPEVVLTDATSKPTRLSFEGALRRLNERGLGMVFMLDEFEGLALNRHVDVNLFNALRSAAGRLRLAFITASAQPLYNLTYVGPSKTLLSSPFFNIFAQLFLGLLPETEARTLIRTPMEAAGIVVDSQLEDFIYQLVGGHPLGLQIACYHAWADRSDLHSIEQRTTQELEAHFEYYWRHLSSAERELLRHAPEAHLGEASDPATRSTLHDLTQKCLLVPVSGSYSYPSKAWAEFVSAQPQDSTEISSTGPPPAGDSGSTRDPTESASRDAKKDRALARRSDGKKSGIAEVFRESLPEMLGGLGVAIVLGTVGLIYTQLPVLLEKARGLLNLNDVPWLVLAILGMLGAGIFGRRMTVARKQARLTTKQSGQHLLEIIADHSDSSLQSD